MATGLVPVDEALALAGLSEYELHEWTPGNIAAHVPSVYNSTHYDSLLLGIKMPGAPASRYAREGILTVEFPYTDSAEQIAERIRQALSKVNA